MANFFGRRVRLWGAMLGIVWRFFVEKEERNRRIVRCVLRGRVEWHSTSVLTVPNWSIFASDKRRHFSTVPFGDNWWIVLLCLHDEQTKRRARIRFWQLLIPGFSKISRFGACWCGIFGRVGYGEIEQSLDFRLSCKGSVLCRVMSKMMLKGTFQIRRLRSLRLLFCRMKIWHLTSLNV